MRHLFIFGFGYSARVFAERCMARGWQVSGTSRSAAGVAAIAASGAQGYLFDGAQASASAGSALDQATHVLISAGPDDDGDPVLRFHGDDLAACGRVQWLGYLSTVGVYGDHDGAWVDETTPTRPVSARSRRRVAAEQAWTAFAREAGMALQIFRLAGIYGPGRGPLEKLRAGTSRRIIKPGQVFNRIHVADIAQVLEAGAERAGSSGIYNVADDEPAPPQDVIAYGAELLGLPVPPEVAFENADLGAMGRSFYSENKRVCNDKMKAAFEIALAYPSYREGLAAIAAQS